MQDERIASGTAPAPAAPHRRRAADDDRLTWTIPEAANRLGISRGAAYEAAHRGELPIRWFGRRMLVPRSALLKLLEDGGLPEGSRHSGPDAYGGMAG